MRNRDTTCRKRPQYTPHAPRKTPPQRSMPRCRGCIRYFFFPEPPSLEELHVSPKHKSREERNNDPVNNAHGLRVRRIKLHFFCF